MVGSTTTLERGLVHQTLSQDGKVIGVFISPEEYTLYQSLLDADDIIQSTEQAEQSGPHFETASDAMSYLSSL